MINSILKSTKGKPCTCPSGKICLHCKPKNYHPPVTVRKSKNILDPGNSTYYTRAEKKYKQNPITAHFLKNSRGWKIRKWQKYEPQTPKSTSICRWYKRRKALKQLTKEHEKEKEILRQRKREEFERERMIELINWEQKKQQKLSTLSPSLKTFKWKKTTTQSLPPHPKKLKHIKNKTAIAKPRAHSKYASVKQHNPRDSITVRFVNYCYRFCCQLYCYLTCIFIISFIIIFIV